MPDATPPFDPHALKFDLSWAHMQARRWRVRAIDRQIPVDRIDNDEIVSIISDLWWRVAAGETGQFRPRRIDRVPEDLCAYVAGCIDNEMARALREEYAVGGVLLPKRCKATFDSTIDAHAHEDEDWARCDNADPLVALLERDEVDVCTWAGRFGAILEHYFDAARSMTVLQARQARSRVFEKGEESRPNTAWAVVMAGSEHNPAAAKVLAPMLVARWAERSGGSIVELRASTYPHLDKDPEKTRLIAAHEARALLRWLARICGNETGVTAEHLEFVARDAAEAMVGWVGQRGPYKTKAQRAAEQAAARESGQVQQSLNFEAA